MTQLIFHLIGDYLLQSHWMAVQKTKSTWAAFCHATTYSLLFLFIASWPAWFVIWGTHLLIDRFRLARYVVYAKNFLAPITTEVTPQATGPGKTRQWLDWWHPWEECQPTGYHESVPAWLAGFLCIAADNTLHLAINAAAIYYL